jgi:virulence factor Mce-like protein
VIKVSPTPLQLTAIVGFVLSCFGLALYLWISFGGPSPLAARNYEVKVPFDEATQLAEQADVRVAGVPIGKVEKVELPPGGDRAMATLSIDPEYAPLPADSQAILRGKTLLGETYVELTLGDEDGPTIPEGGELPRAQVAETVQLDEILRTFDPKTREAFQTWIRDSATGISGRGDDLSWAIALFAPTFERFDELLRTVDSQRKAVQQLFRNGAVTFRALRGRSNDLAEMIEAGEEVLATTGARDQELIEMFRVFPTFLAESKETLARTREFAQHADPLVRQLTPAARELSPMLIETGRLAPELEGFMEGLRPVVDRADRAFPAFQRLFRRDFPPLLKDIDPFLDQFNPLLDTIRAYRRDLAAVLANAAAMTNASATVGRRSLGKAKYLRSEPMLTPHSFASSPGRAAWNRTNAYSRPGIYGELLAGLQSFDTRHCGAGTESTLSPAIPTDPLFIARAGGDPDDAQDLFDRIKRFSFGNGNSTTDVTGPACRQQGPFGPFGGNGAARRFPHTLRMP